MRRPVVFVEAEAVEEAEAVGAAAAAVELAVVRKESNYTSFFFRFKSLEENFCFLTVTIMLVKLNSTSPFITDISPGPHPLPWETNSFTARKDNFTVV